MNKFYFLFFLLSFFINISYAQKDLLFEHFSVSNGLSNPSANCMLQDRLGFLWIGTDDGLNRYDGYNFKVYKNNPADTTSIPANSIYSLMEDHKGNLWVGGQGTLAIYNRGKDGFTPIVIDRGSITGSIQVWGLYEDSKKRIWVGTRFHGVYLIDSPGSTAKIINKKESISQNDWNWPQCFIESHSGRILVTDTEDGIYYFDEESSEFIRDKKLSLPGARSTFALYEDEFNRFWLGDAAGVRMIDPGKNKVSTIDIFNGYNSPPPDKRVLRIINDQNGYLWFGAWKEGLFRHNPVSGETIHFYPNSTKPGSIVGSQIVALYEDKYGIIWAGTSNSGLNKVDPEKEPLNIYQIPAEYKSNNVTSDMITSIAISKKNKNTVWIGTQGIGLFKYDKKSGTTRQFLHQPGNKNSISSNNISNLDIDLNDNLWIATDSSFVKYEPDNKFFSHYLQENNGLSYDFDINDIQIDATGRIYIASPHGLDLLIPGSDILRRIPTLMNRKYNNALMSRFRELSQEEALAKLITVGERQDLKEEIELKQDTKILVLCSGEGIYDQIFAMADYGWLLDSNGDTVWAMDDITKTFYAGGGVKNRIQAACLELKAGTYTLQYITDVGHSFANWNVAPPDDSTWYGIQLLTLEDSDYAAITQQINDEKKRKDYIKIEEVLSIYLSRKYENTMWIGARNGNIFKYNLKDNSYKRYNLNARFKVAGNYIINDIMEDIRGKVWFCSNQGLIEFDSQSEKFITYTDKDGLSSNSTLAMQEDNYGNLWVSSIAGLTKIIRTPDESKYTFINIDVEDGLQGYSFTRASWKAEDGELYFGGFNGMNYFYSGKLNRSLPDLVFNDFKISNQTVSTANTDTPLEVNINDSKGISLTYDQNDISFEFAPIHFSRPQRNKIAYKLDGLNEDWVYDNRRFASFTNLEPGEYIFRLKGSNGDGIWTSEEKQIAVSILPPWYRTTLAYILYGLIFVAAIFAIDRFQRRRLLKRARERARIREAELRAQLAEAENERKSKELEEARALQLSMLPKELPQLPHLDIAVYMQTATEVGGDYYDFHVAMDGTLTVVIGDATGHGMKAGTMVTTAKTLFKSYAPNPDILFAFKEFTRCIREMNFGKLSMCLTMVKISGNKVQISSAGMPPSLIFRRDTRVVEEHLFKAMPLGTMEKFPYELKDTTLKAGDTILLMSDGLPELENADGKMYGYKKIRNSFEDVAEKSPEDIISYLKNEGADWVNNADPDDDVTFVVIKVK